MLTFIVTLSNLIIVSLAVSQPSCRWFYDYGIQAADICIQAYEGNDYGLVDLKYECTSEGIQMNIYEPNKDCAGAGPHTIRIINDTSEYNCSQEICSSDTYAIWENHYAPYACSVYTGMALITDTCLPVDAFHRDNGNYYIVSVFNDTSMTPSFDIESIFYEDADCSVVSDCYVWSDRLPDECLNETNINSLLVSYQGTQTKSQADCTRSDDGNGGYNVSTIDMDCNWVYWREWYHVIGICGQDRYDGDWYDTQIVCNGSSVSQFWYDSNDMSCSGNHVHEEFITADSKYFKCSSSVCQDNYMSFIRYDDCNISQADISRYNVITNQCLLNVEDGTRYIASCNVYDNGYNGSRYGYDFEGIFRFFHNIFGVVRCCL